MNCLDLGRNRLGGRWRTKAGLALAALAGGHASMAQASWLVYTDAGAGARSDTIASDSSLKCSGTLASKDYCGPSAQISSDDSSLTATANATAYPDPHYNSGYGYQHGDAYASADLATGKLRISDHAISDGIPSENTYGDAQATMQDVLHFNSFIESPFAVAVHLHVDGRFDGYQQPNFGFHVSDSLNDLVAGTSWYGANYGVPTCVGNPGSYCAEQAQALNLSVPDGWTQLGLSDFYGNFLVDPKNPDVAVSMGISAGGSTSTNYMTTYAEFGHTASISLDLPTGVTFTSDSGTFLSATALPEPSAWVMMVIAYGLVGTNLRRRHLLAPST